MLIRPRRNRKSLAIRKLIQENVVTVDDLMAPLFVIEGKGTKTPIESMPGQFRFTLDLLVEECQQLNSLGIKSVSLFPAIEEKLKDSRASNSLKDDTLINRATRAIKNALPNMAVMTDVAMDPYSCDGHDGIVDQESGEILNDETLEILTAMAINQAEAGSDIIGPSDMMDGRVQSIRKGLDESGFSQVSIMSYTAKYASSFYGPFRQALDSAPKSGDKCSYQMDPANRREAMREASLDEAEGADILMVKPGLAYLDVLRDLREACDLPLAIYQVSGEYAMIMAAYEKGWIDKDQGMMETLTSFKRAGADIVLTYFAKDLAQKLN